MTASVPSRVTAFSSYHKGASCPPPGTAAAFVPLICRGSQGCTVMTKVSNPISQDFLVAFPDNSRFIHPAWQLVSLLHFRFLFLKWPMLLCLCVMFIKHKQFKTQNLWTHLLYCLSGKPGLGFELDLCPGSCLEVANSRLLWILIWASIHVCH